MASSSSKRESDVEGLGSGWASDAAITSREGETARRVATRAGKLYVALKGRGDPVLLLHGIGSSADAFRYQHKELTNAYRLIAWDAPGYARSDDPLTPLTMDDYADAAKEVLDTLGVGRAHITGVSWGGVVATRLALRHPHRVKSLVLIGSTPGRRESLAAASDLRCRAERIAEEGIVAYARARVKRVLSPDAPTTLLKEVEEIMVASVRLPGYQYAAEALAATDHRGDLSRIEAPTLVLVGEHDIITGLRESRALAGGIPGARLAVIPGAGHLANQEGSELVNAELRRHWFKTPGALDQGGSVGRRK